MMDSVIVFLNRFFRPPRVEGRESEEAYSQWEHRWGKAVARDYLEPHDDLHGKNVLDVGCGLGGKTLAYEESGAALVCGTDILPEYAAAGARYAERHAANGRLGFVTGDALALPFADETFDTVVANDAMEHFREPKRALGEMHRVVKRGGAVWVFFTPHYSPLGSHLYDYIYVPWCHLLFGRNAIERAIARILQAAGTETVDDRVREIMTSYDQDLNHMSVRWFLRIVRAIPSLEITFLELRPAKFGWLKPLTAIPLARELFTGFVVCRLERGV